MASPSSVPRRRRGRPRKFAVPSRAVTLTLPDETLAQLTHVDADLSHAIVRLVQAYRPVARMRPAAELTSFGRRAVITVRRTTSLERRVGLDLIPLPDGRALISFDQANTVSDLELMLNDALEEKTLPRDERQVFEAIRAMLKDARRSSEVTLLRRSIVVLEYGTARTQRTGGRQSG